MFFFIHLVLLHNKHINYINIYQIYFLSKYIYNILNKKDLISAYYNCGVYIT